MNATSRAAGAAGNIGEDELSGATRKRLGEAVRAMSAPATTLRIAVQVYSAHNDRMSSYRAERRNGLPLPTVASAHRRFNDAVEARHAGAAR